MIIVFVVAEMFGSCLLIVVIAALYEGLKVVRDSLLQKAWSMSCNGDAIAVPTSDIPTVVEAVKVSKRFVWCAVVLTGTRCIELQGYLYSIQILY